MTLETQRIVIPYRHRDWAKEVERELGQNNLLCLHRGAGKTVFAVYRLIHASLFTPSKPSGLPHRFGYVAKSISHAKQIVWDLFKYLLAGFGKSVSFNGNDLLITFPNANTILLTGIDDAEKNRGQHFSGLVVDEAQMCTRATWDKILRPTLTQNRGWCILIGTPDGPQGFFYETWLAGNDASNPYWRTFTYDVHKTGEIDEDLWQEILHTTDVQTVEQEYLCKFTATLNFRVYPNFDASGEIRDGKPPHIRKDIVDHGGVLYVGLDFNQALMPAIICQKVQYDGIPSLEVVSEIVLRDSNTERMADTLLRHFPERELIICPDATGASEGTAKVRGSDFDILRRAGFQIFSPKKNPPIHDRVTAVNVLLENAAGTRRLFVHPRCTELIKSLTYQQKDPYTGLPEKQKDTSKGLDHAVDALGYTVMSTFPLKHKVFTKKIWRI